MRTVLVTGGAGGLGSAIARLHLSMGDTVWALDLRENDVSRELSANDRFRFLPCDISSTESVRCAVLPRLEEIGRLDFLYSCAGIYNFADKALLPETDLDRAAKMYDINAVGFLRVVQAVFPAIQDGTHILCVTSEAGSVSMNWRSGEYNYCMSKAAENMACAILRHHYQDAGQNTRVICLHPGWLRTAMGGEDAFKNPDRSVAPEDSAKAIVDLALGMDRLPADQNYLDYLGNRYTW